MKKLLLSLFALLALAPFAYAGECEKITDVNDYWVKVKSGVNIRDKVCDITVTGRLSAGTLIKVRGETEDRRYISIERPGGGMGFIWSGVVENTSAPDDETEKEALYDITGHHYEQVIRYLASKNIVSGYPDKTYKPDRVIDRAEFTKIVVVTKLGYEPVDSAGQCFPDFQATDWFASYVCYAKDHGIVKGYADGTFKAADKIKLAEAAKILANTLDLNPAQETEIWYQVYLEALQENNYIPDSFSHPAQLVDRGQMAEMVWRILEQIKDQPAKHFTFDEMRPSSILGCADQGMPATINMQEVRQAWFSWVNEARGKNNLIPYQPSDVLNSTAQAWSDYSAQKGVMSHQRPGQTDYYDYPLITQWFKDLGVTFKNAGGVTYSENIGRTFIACNDDDCTQELIDGTKLIFNAYMAEKGTKSTAHYDSVMNPAFRLMGVAWSKRTDKEIYVTIHYASAIEQAPLVVCQ